MGSHRYPHVLMGFIQTPLANDWAHTVTRTFSWESHRHPSLMIGLTQVPTLSHGVHRHLSLIFGLTQIPNTFPLGSHRRPLVHGTQQIAGLTSGHHWATPKALRLSMQWAHTGTAAQYHQARRDESPLTQIHKYPRFIFGLKRILHH